MSKPKRWSWVCLCVAACGPTIVGGDGGGTGTGDGTANTSAASSPGGSDANEPTADGTTAGGPCEGPANVPELRGSTIEVETDGLLFAVAALAGSPALDLLLVTESEVRVLPGTDEGLPLALEGNTIASDVDVPTFIQAIAVGEVLGAAGNDVVVLDDGDFIEVWDGDGSGAFTVAITAALPSMAYSTSIPVVVDMEGDGQAEIAIALGSGEVAVIHDVAIEPSITLVDTGFLEAFWMGIVPSWVAPDGPPIAFVNGYGPGVGNLVWAPVDALGEWTAAQVPFVHVGDMIVDRTHDDASPRWTGIETHDDARLVSGLLPLETEQWQLLELGVAAPWFDGLEAVAYPGGHDVVAAADGLLTLVDLDCGSAVGVDAAPIIDQLRTADIDGDGLMDILARGELGVSVASPL